MDVEKSEVLLAKWVSGEMSEKELSAFKKTEDYELFSRIIKESSLFKRPSVNKEEVYSNILQIQKKRREKTKKGKVFSMSSINLKTLTAIAASIAVFLAGLYFFSATIQQEADFGEQLAIKLPDNSEVILNSKSSVSYNKRTWSKERVLRLEGEAYFKVTKGSTFKVETDEGSTSVLGTQFSVLESENFLEVKCFEGKVKVERNGYVVVLTEGKTFSQYKNAKPLGVVIEKSEPDWLKGESSFQNTPLKVVLKSLEKQYQVKIESNKIEENKIYTGSFVHSDIELALEAVLLPMNIDYELSKDKEYVKIK